MAIKPIYRVPRPSERPETISQAKHWETVLNKYKKAGLCTRCAAQAAWGHQNGFTTIHEPCDLCMPIVQTFDTPTANHMWRKIRRPTGGSHHKEQEDHHEPHDRHPGQQTQ